MKHGWRNAVALAGCDTSCRRQKQGNERARSPSQWSLVALAECGPRSPMTAEEQIFEFMLLDASCPP
jgi:hypothetical protein